MKKIDINIDIDDFRKLGQRMKAVRLDRQLTINDVEEYFSFDAGVIQRLESGDMTLSIDVLIKCMMAYRYIEKPKNIIPKEPYSIIARPRLTEEEMQAIYDRF